MRSSKSNSENQFNYLLIVALFIYALSTAVHAVSHYSGVPLWDSWLGMIDFLNNYQEKGVYYWFSQHFEHRIFITRIFFWLDYKFFDAQNWFLIAINYFLASLIFLLFVKIIQEIFQDQNKEQEEQKYLKNLLIFVSFIFTFSKIQNDNFSWEFQSQFFLAYLLPLFSLYLLGKSSESFIFACFFGVLSSLTMANGVFTLFFMAIAGFLLKIDRNRIFILLGLAFLTLFTYLFDYQKPQGHSFIESLYYPADLFLYLISYFGSAVYFIFGSILAKIFGLLLLILSLTTFLQIIRNRVNTNWSDIILIVFISYVIFSGLLTAIGRIGPYDVEQAFAQRYTTPVFMAMISLLIIYRNYLKKYFVFFLTLPFLLFQIGMADIKEGERKVFEKNVAALALELDIMDKDQIVDESWVAGDFPYYMEQLTAISREASKNNISIFNDPLIKDVKEKIGKKIKNEYCSNKINSMANIREVDKEENFYFIHGMIDENKYFDDTKSFYLSNDSKVIGYVLLNHDKTEFKGYSLYSKNIYLYDIVNKCKIKNGE